MRLPWQKPKLDVQKIVTEVTIGAAGIAAGGFIFGYTSEHGRALAVNHIRKKDSTYGDPIINVFEGGSEVPSEYAGGYDVNLYDDEDDDDEDDVEEETTKQPTKMKQETEVK